jgi:hypothetical protein
LWFECGTKVGTKKPNRDHQTLGCLKGENENLSAALDRIRSKISSLKEQVKR